MTRWGTPIPLAGGVSARVGVELSYAPTSVTPSTTAVTVTWRLLVQVLNGVGSGNDSWQITGTDGPRNGTTSWSVTSVGGTAVIASGTRSVALVYGQAQSFTFGGTLLAVGPTSNNATVSDTLAIPARPISSPTAVSNLVATRDTDTRQVLSWTNNATPARPYASLQVWRSVNGGAASRVATLPGTATTYADTATQAGRAYDYEVRAVNAAGSAGRSAPRVWTTPLVPAAPVATKTETGDVVVARPALSFGATWDVRHVETGDVLATGLNGPAWTHPDPSPVTAWTYQARAVVPSSPVLRSGWSASSTTIQLITPPYAPTPTGPSVADPAEEVVLTWRHNPADGTGQRSYQIESRATSADAWVPFTLRIYSTVSEHRVAPGVWAGQTGRQFRVRTWGQHADPSPYSGTGVVVLSARPVVGITTPAGASHDSPQLSVRWSFFDPEGSAQTSWRVVLLDDEAAELEAKSGFGSGRFWGLRTALADGGTYVLQVSARDGSGLWSLVDERQFVVTYAPPATPVLEADFRPDDGYTILTAEAGTGGTVALSHVRLERATRGGWQVLHDDLPAGTSVPDMLPPLGAAVAYRAVAVSVTGSVAYSDPVTVDTSTRWLFLNFGPGFGSVVRVWGDLRAGRGFSRDKTLKRYSGRPLPVERAGVARERSYSLTASLFAPWLPPDPTSSYEDLEALADAPAPVCVRDPEGVKLFVSTSGVDLADHLSAKSRASLTLTQVDSPEGMA